ncbi:hypothetical protein GIB67_028971 [Kingdonia uniflora]|uniref:GTP cyclohydrolase 1 n=1 Tax=Kingdonia uniflora TaxID=39325 RepID=A0A7J7LC24_9MAGN|nr:hypothetical protein GIB67_028971 [Kingdonia uniflora]
MGALDGGHYNGKLENGVKFNGGCLEEEEKETTTATIEDAVKVLLQALGEDSNREGLKKTPLRVAKALREGTRGYKQKVKDIVQGSLFPEAGLDSGVGHAGGAGGLVVVRDIDLFSYCESCLLPFQVRCHVGYVPSGQRVVGLSKLSRVADVFAKRLQDPQRLADKVCLALHNGIKPAGVAVALECWHIQFPGVERTCTDSHHPSKVNMQGWIKVSVCSSSGVFDNKNEDAWADFLSLLKLRGVNMEEKPLDQCWCPSGSLNVPICNGHKNTRNTMTTAVGGILHSLGEDPIRKELLGTPQRFCQWLMNFKKSSNLEMKMNGFGAATEVDPLQANLSRDDKIYSEINLPLWSLCEHHLLPFYGVVHIGYFQGNENQKSITRSSLQSIVHFHGSKLQVQERLTRQIAETYSSVFGCGDVMVVVEANHICMISRGIEKVGSSTATIAVLGRFSTDSAAKAAFLQMVSTTTATAGR